MEEKLKGSVPGPRSMLFVAPDWLRLIGPLAGPATTTLPLLTLSCPFSTPPTRVVSWLAGGLMPLPTLQLVEVNMPP